MTEVHSVTSYQTTTWLDFTGGTVTLAELANFVASLEGSGAPDDQRIQFNARFTRLTATVKHRLPGPTDGAP